MIFIDTPANTLKAAQQPGGLTNFYMRLRRETARLLYEMSDIPATPEQLRDAAEFMSRISGLDIRIEQACILLRLYPPVRTRLVKYKDVEDPEVRDGLAFVLAHFFLACRWPRSDEDISYKDFISLLQRQACRMGFKRLQQSPEQFHYTGLAPDAGVHPRSEPVPPGTSP